MRAFGDPTYGGDLSNIPLNVSSFLTSDGIASITANAYAFVALKPDGTIGCWGKAYAGGGTTTINTLTPSLYGVVRIYANRAAFACVLTNHHVSTIGNPNYGGQTYMSVGLVEPVAATVNAFAGLTGKRSVVIWGAEENGGVYNSTYNQPQLVHLRTVEFHSMK